MKGDDGSWHYSNGDLGTLISNYFQQLFTSHSSSVGDIFERVTPLVTGDQNLALMAAIEAMEVRNAIFSMYPDKAPSPNGMNLAFFQKLWSIIRNDVVQFCEDCFSSCSFPNKVNDNLNTLISKKKFPVFVTNLRPLSLYNVFVDQ